MASSCPARILLVVVALVVLVGEVSRAEGALLVTEIMHSPRLRPDLFTFIELHNTAAATLDLGGYSLSGTIII